MAPSAHFFFILYFECKILFVPKLIILQPKSTVLSIDMYKNNRQIDLNEKRTWKNFSKKSEKNRKAQKPPYFGLILASHIWESSDMLNMINAYQMCSIGIKEVSPFRIIRLEFWDKIRVLIKGGSDDTNSKVRSSLSIWQNSIC